jgi:hypothetical protein
MEYNNRSNNKYESKSMDTKSGDNNKILEELWTAYSKKGPKFTFRDFEHIFSAIKNDGKSESDVDNLKKLFRRELELVKKYANKYSRKILNEVGKANLTDSQIFEYVMEQSKKHSFSRPITDAIYREVSHRLSEFPSRSSYFRFTPYKNTKVGKGLGYSSYENYNSVRVGKEDKDTIDNIMKLHQANLMTHDFIVKQSLSYTDCALGAITGEFKADSNNPMVSVSPVVAALFIPKINILEETMLLSSITNIIKARVNNEPILTRPDYELFYNLCTDKNEYVCDSKSLWEDLKTRSIIQVALWRSVASLRSGRYYDVEGAALMQALNDCKFYRYEAMDLAYTDDAGDMLRRLFYTFSLKPIFVQTLPVQPASSVSIVSPFSNLDLYNGEMDTLPMVNLRLNNLNSSITNVNLQNVINDVEYYFDSSNNMIIPKLTKVVDARGILVVYVHRRNYSVDITRQTGPFIFSKLPVTTLHNYKINTTCIETGEEIELNGNSYDLRSVVCNNTIATIDNQGVQRDIVNGSLAFIHPKVTVDGNTAFAVDEWISYDPINVNLVTLGSDGVQRRSNTPFTSRKWRNDENPLTSVELIAGTTGIIYVFTKKE